MGNRLRALRERAKLVVVTFLILVGFLATGACSIPGNSVWACATDDWRREEQTVVDRSVCDRNTRAHAWFVADPRALESDDRPVPGAALDDDFRRVSTGPPVGAVVNR